MTLYKCLCGHKDDIEWSIKGVGLKESSITFNCPKCDREHTFRITFPVKKGENVKVTEKAPDYIQ